MGGGEWREQERYRCYCNEDLEIKYGKSENSNEYNCAFLEENALCRNSNVQGRISNLTRQRSDSQTLSLYRWGNK